MADRHKLKWVELRGPAPSVGPQNHVTDGQKETNQVPLMAAVEYRRVTSEPDVFKGDVLRSIAKVLQDDRSEHVHAIGRALESPGIPKPLEHKTPEGYDYYRVFCSADVAEQVFESLLSSEAAAVGSQGETTPLASFYASLVDRWSIYVTSFEGDTTT